MNYPVYLHRGLRYYGGMELDHNPCDVFVDNPLFSEMIMPDAQGQASKRWQRFVPQQAQVARAFLPAQPGEESDWQRLCDRWRRQTGQDLWDLWRGWHPVMDRPDLPWLVCEPRTEILEYWSGCTLVEWRQQVQQDLARRGQSAVFRPKPSRKVRCQRPDDRVINQVHRYRGVITAHSVTAIDALLAGRPAVIWGQDPTGGLAQPYEIWRESGQVRVPELEQVQQQAWTWASVTHDTLDPNTHAVRMHRFLLVDQ